MALQESIFLFKVSVYEIEKFTQFSSNFYAQCKFADMFITHLEDIDCLLKPLRYPIKAKRKRGGKSKKFKIKYETVKSGPSVKLVLFSCEIKSFMAMMRKDPIEIYIWRRDLRQKIGAAHIPWPNSFRLYLRDMLYVSNRDPVTSTGDYYAMDAFTSTCVARLGVSLTLCRVRETVPTLLRSFSETNLTVYFAQIQTNPNFRKKNNDISETPSFFVSRSDNFDKQIVSYKASAKQKTEEPIFCMDCNASKKIEIMEIVNENNDFRKGDQCENGKDSSAYRKYMETLLHLTRSDTELTKHEKPLDMQLNISRSQMEIGPKYVRSNPRDIYVVSYFTVHDKNSDPSQKKTSDESDRQSVHKYSESPKSAQSGSNSKSDKGGKQHSSGQGSDKSHKDDPTPPSTANSNSKETNVISDDIKTGEKYYFKACEDVCPVKHLADRTGMEVNLPKEAEELIKIKKCKHVTCDHRPQRPAPVLPDDEIFVDFKDILAPCCQKTEQVKTLMTGVTMMSVDGVPCECTCECSFGFIKKTTYCEICGGFEAPGDDEKRGHPCPVFHKLVDMKKLKALTSSGSSGKSATYKTSKMSNKSGSQKSTVSKSSAKTAFDKKSQVGEVTEEGENKKRKKGRNIDPRFIFHYGFTGIPAAIGHDFCTSPCTGTRDPVPRYMGWLWTADNVPGLKFRPGWRPGAISKYVLMLLRNARNPGLALLKRKRKEIKKKKNVKRPLLVVTKHDGEYTVTMETMKVYSKPRTLNQHPYEEKPVLTYTIGRTEEENMKRQRRRAHELLQLQREQRIFIQDTFRNLCKEICGKTYEQALGLLPGGEDPTCPCYVRPPNEETLNDIICSCNEKESLPDTETDDDSWVVEFTPPVALYEPQHKPNRAVKVDISTQYTYLDYKVKVYDANGKEYPRYFQGPDGKTQCTDLGGFCGPNKKWLEINYDGIIGPDGKWCPMRFNGPSGEIVDIELNGKFLVMGVGTFVVGVDGYVDASGNWKSYPKPRKLVRPARDSPKSGKSIKDKDKVVETAVDKPNVVDQTVQLSCFGDASPLRISNMGIVGHGYNKKLLMSALNALIAQGEKVNLPQPSSVPRLSTPTGRKASKLKEAKISDKYDHATCYHPPPSQKGVIIDKRGRKKYFKIDLESKNRGARSPSETNGKTTMNVHALLGDRPLNY